MMAQTPEQAKKMQMESTKKTGLSAKKKSGKCKCHFPFLGVHASILF